MRHVQIFKILALCLFLSLVENSVAMAAGSTEIAAVISRIFADDATSTGSDEIDANFETIRDFYKSRNFKPIWTRDNGPKSKGKALFQELKRSSIHGLSPSFYNVEGIAELIDKLGSENLAKLDMLLSGALIEYAHDLMNGRIGDEAHFSHNQVVPVSIAADKLIKGAADAGNLRVYASELLSTDSRYFRLIAKYAEFSRMEAADLWPVIKSDGAGIKAGDTDERMAKIRRLLAFSGDLPAEFMEGGPIHDDNTVQGVRQFQKRHGISVSGEIDQATLREMAVSLKQRKIQVLINLERRRWQNRELQENSLYINLADHSAKLVRGGKTKSFLNVLPDQKHQQVPTFFGKVIAIKSDADGFEDIKLMLEPSPDENSSYERREFSVGFSDAQEFQKAFGDNLSSEIDITQQQTMELNEPLDLYVTYLTAWANKNGSVHFRPDVLARDGELAKLLKLN